MHQMQDFACLMTGLLWNTKFYLMLDSGSLSLDSTQQHVHTITAKLIDKNTLSSADPSSSEQERKWGWSHGGGGGKEGGSLRL